MIKLIGRLMRLGLSPRRARDLAEAADNFGDAVWRIDVAEIGMVVLVDQ